MSYPNHGRPEYSSYQSNNNYDSYNHPPSQPYNTTPVDHNQGYNSPYSSQYPTHSPYGTSSANLGDYNAQPQHSFAGQALYQQNSYAASNQSLNYAQSEYASSVYALNEPKEGGHNSTDVPMSPMGGKRNLEEKRAIYESPKKSKRKMFLVSGFGLIVILAVAGFAVYWFAFRKSSSNSSSGSGKSSQAVFGADGSSVLLENGTSFTYTNPHGGYWYYDVNDPFKNAAKAQSWTPALNETFNYGVDKIRGSPALFEKYKSNATHPVDEYTLHQVMSPDEIEEHYKTFITEQDFAEIAAAGLNFVRIPIPFWAIEVRDGEPFLPKVAWKYFLKGVEWARKYGIRINLDLHAVPGSQN
ncbi:hypothetical protein V5O48_016397, partial [Marasmius crinis-equi]